MLEIRESQIEDILATYLDETRKVLSVRSNISLIDRQKKLPSGGILDLLFISANNLLLVELKVVRSELKFCKQVVDYRKDISVLQKKGKLPRLPMKSYLVCPDFLENHKQFCYKNDIIPIKFSPYELLKSYYLKVKAITKLINLKPSNHGLWNLNLLNRILYVIDKEADVTNLAQTTKLSKSTIGSYLRLSNELGLTKTKPKVILSELGLKFVDNRERDKPVDYIGNI